MSHKPESLLSSQGGLPIKSDGGGGVRMLRVPNFVKNYIIGCANSQKYTAGWANLQKNYTAGYPIFIHKGLVKKLLKLLACQCWP